jgi:hypothetical protein
MAPRVALLMSIAIVAPLPIGRAQVVEQAVLAAQDGTARSAFGSALAIEGDRIVVGVPDDDEQALDAGAVYIFERRLHFGWVEVAKLMATHPAPEGHFGRSLSLQGDRVLIGALDFPGDPHLGRAYVFERSAAGAWEAVAEFEPGDGAQGLGGNFAIDVALDGDRALIGAQEAYVTGGAGYVFERAASGVWLQTAKLSPPTVVGIGLAGTSVALEGDVALLGSPWDDDPAGCLHTGSVVVFERDPHGGWVETQEIHSSEELCGGTFGHGLALDGDRALVGCPNYNADPHTGSAYIFQRNSSGIWQQAAKLVAPDASETIFFGGGALSRDWALVRSAKYYKLHAPGKAYLFHRQPNGDWPLAAKIESSADTASEGFGGVVAMSENRAVIGAPTGDGVEPGTGIAYVLEFGPATDEDATAAEPESR